MNKVGIACVHTGFNIVATLVLLPFSNILERLSLMIIKPDEEELARAEKGPEFIRLDERFLSTPSFALEQANSLVIKNGRNHIRFFKRSDSHAVSL